jgi:hypothetical protein
MTFDISYLLGALLPIVIFMELISELFEFRSMPALLSRSVVLLLWLTIILVKARYVPAPRTDTPRKGTQEPPPK